MNKNFTGIILLVLMIFAAFSAAIQIGQGEFVNAYTTLVLVLVIPGVMMLGVRSWYLLPFAMLAQLPAIPLIAGKSLSLSEVSILLLLVTTLIAIASHKFQFKVYLKDWRLMLIFSLWILFIGVINGGGFSILGGDSIGGRRYLTVIFAVIGMTLLSQVAILEKEAKRVCFLLFLAISLSGLYECFKAYMGYATGEKGEASYSFYSWQQGLAFVALSGVVLLFARIQPSKVIRNPAYVLLYCAFLAMAAYSGKRMGFAGCCLIPIFACFWHRQHMIALFMIMAGTLAVIFAVVTQNNITAIPQSMQRVLYFIPADWDWEVEQSTVNSFRETLNRLAVEKVKENPIIGEGVALTPEDYWLMHDKNYVRSISGPDDDVQAFPHAAGKNWHSTWLGLSASFGIPAGIIWLFIQINVVRRTYRMGRAFRGDSWRQTLLGMLFLLMLFGIMRSWSSGEIAILIMDGALAYGLMRAILNGVNQEASAAENCESES